MWWPTPHAVDWNDSNSLLNSQTTTRENIKIIHRFEDLVQVLRVGFLIPGGRSYMCKAQIRAMNTGIKIKHPQCKRNDQLAVSESRLLRLS